MKKEKVWQRSKTANLYRHVSTGVYYARTKSGGIDKWATLETTVFSVAEQRVRKKIAELRRGRSAAKALTEGIATFGEAAEAYKDQVDLNVHLKPASKHYRKQTIAALLSSWPGLNDRKLADVTPADCQKWANGYAKTLHPTRFNNTVDSLRHIFELGIDKGLIFQNPAADIPKLKVTSKKLKLPNHQKFSALVTELEKGKGAYSRDCADLVRFLAYSGCRIAESAQVRWEHIDGKKGVIWIHGDPDTGTKNSEARSVPIIAPMRELLDKLADRQKQPRSLERRNQDFVLNVMECTKALQRACDQIEIPRISHHDLRHLFATRCIESGVDIPTVSRWLGHKDGGALAMKTYGHLRDEHSQAMAAKVEF